MVARDMQGSGRLWRLPLLPARQAGSGERQAEEEGWRGGGIKSESVRAAARRGVS